MLVANVDGTRNLMRAALAAGIERIVYTSSVATLGLADDGAGNEDSPVAELDMIGPYKRSKFLAEALVRRMIADEALPAVIVNPSTPVGPFDIRPTPTGRLIVEAAARRMPAYVDTGLNIVHVDDVGRGHVLAYEKGLVGRRYILGGEDLPLAAILAEIAAIYGRRPPGSGCRTRRFCRSRCSRRPGPAFGAGSLSPPSTASAWRESGCSSRASARAAS